MTEINVFYFHQPRPDDFHSSSLLLDGGRVWYVGRKGKSNDIHCKLLRQKVSNNDNSI